jgi:hypothetical protein
VSLRSKLESAFAAEGKSRPTTFQEAVIEYGPRLIPGFGKGLYDAGLRADAALWGETITTDTAPEVVQDFMDRCPPFRATLYAFLMSWYQHSARDESGEKFKAGRNDLFMASYLPYCDIFVTAEIKREQERCLKELTLTLGLNTEVLTYDEFVGRL